MEWCNLEVASFSISLINLKMLIEFLPTAQKYFSFVQKNDIHSFFVYSIGASTSWSGQISFAPFFHF